MEAAAGARTGAPEPLMPFKILALAAALFAASPAVAEPPARADAAALTALAAEADNAWTLRDVSRMTAVYADQASLLVGAMPQAREGRLAIADYIDGAFVSRQGEWRHVTRLTRMEAVGPGLVLSDAVVDVDQRQPDGSWKTMRRFNNVTLAERQSDGWRIRTVRAFPMP